MIDPKLKTLANKIRDQTLRKKTLTLIENPSFKLDGETYSGMPLGTAPAGKSHHHCYPKGYIEHVAATSEIASALCDIVEKVYHGKVDRDLVTAGILLHDVFKPATYSANKNGSYGSTAVAEYLDHLTIATSELVRRDFPIKLVHIVAAHHGEYGPIRPRTLEALVCHLADFADSRLNGEVLNAASYLARRVSDHGLAGMTSKEAFEIVHSKSVEGWKGVKKTLEKINARRRTHKT